MKIACEEKITGEIKRILRHLEEACLEQNLTMEQAVEWWRNATQNEIEKKEPPVEFSSYREKAENFVRNYVNDTPKDICVEVLCFLHDKEECPSCTVIVEAVISKVLLPTTPSDKYRYIRNAIWEFVRATEQKKTHYYIKNTWCGLKNKIFFLAKSL